MLTGVSAPCAASPENCRAHVIKLILKVSACLFCFVVVVIGHWVAPSRRTRVSAVQKDTPSGTDLDNPGVKCQNLFDLQKQTTAQIVSKKKVTLILLTKGINTSHYFCCFFILWIYHFNKVNSLCVETSLHAHTVSS